MESHVGENMYAHWRSVKLRGSTTWGELRVSVTVCPSPTTSAICVSAAPVSGEPMQDLMLNATAAPSSGVPSWNITPSRTLNVQVM